MKKSILNLAAFTIIAGTMLTSCVSSENKAENAETKLEEATFLVDQANEKLAEDIIKYRKEVEDKVAANDKTIAEFKARIEDEKGEVKADYLKKIEELEQKNSDTKKKMEDYKAEGKVKWEEFKFKFNQDMDELGDAFSNFFN